VSHFFAESEKLVNKFTRLLLCAMLASNLISPTPATVAAALDQTTLIICTSLKTGYQLISKTGKCNERIYEARTWFQKGSAQSGTPGSTMLDMRTCISKSSKIQTIRTRAACNSTTTTTSLWQRPLGAAVAPSITSVVMGLLGTATLNIAAPIEDGGARITSYLVTSSPVAVAATYTPAQIRAAKITGLTPGSTYSFSVVAINSKGSSPSSIASAPALAPTIPNVPGITKVVATGTNLAQLTFTAPLDNGGSSVTSYVATSLPGGLQTTVYQSVGGTINITNLSHSTTYTFTLMAINAAGSSLASAISASVTTATPPPPPEPVAVAPSAPTDTVISLAAIAGVTAPVIGATPVSTTTAGTGYTGTVSWSGTPTTFAGVTTYTATITLTPASGYTLTGVTANFFTVAGATTDTNPANSGVVTAVFPATEVGAAREVAITRVSVGTQRRTAFTTQPQITVQDAGGNTVTSSSAVVTATVSAGGTLVGTVTATASSGVATFTGLGVDGTIGTTYTITYSASGLVVATATVTLTGTACDGNTFTCQVGDTGPSGGKIFYVASTFFTQVGATGSMCTTNCKYLEAAPNTWSGGTVDPDRYWATRTNSNETTAVSGADGTAIGTGYQNSVDIANQSGNVAPSSAAVAAREYTGGSKNDWFLPSKDELNQMCKWAKGQAWVSDATVCGRSGTINTGSGASGFVNAAYWSSTEYSANRARFQGFDDGGQAWVDKDYLTNFRPVRAFGPAPILISVAAIAGVTAPVTGATPVTTTTDGTGYTGTVSWSGSPTTFATGATYTATITLTAAAGYTLTGVTANFFTVAGATPVTNSANAGVITAVFYMVGATGPGGGTIFYVAATPFACGPTLAATCTYLEAAPTGADAWTDAAYAWSGNTSAEIGITARGTLLGTGYANTLAIVGQTGGGDTAARAGTITRAYRGPNSLSDWYLPSKDELNQMCKWARGITGVDLANVLTGCITGNNTGLGAAGFVELRYTSSSEYSANGTWYLDFNNGSQGVNYFKWEPFYVRPVRSF
jgi:hypothetical protein